MKTSIVICSYARPTVLPNCLASVIAEAALYTNLEIVLVYRNTDTATKEVMEKFASQSSIPVKVCQADRPGLSVARNVGVTAAEGDLLIFTDDDCLMRPGYLSAVISTMESEPNYSYGGGGVHDPLLNAPDTTHLTQRAAVPPNMIVGAGIFSGCNMFFRKEVFQKIGLFREDMGAGSGMSFVGAEDLEMTTRASFSGMTGILIPNAVIIHNHGRMPGSKELKDLYYSYNVSRGSFYAYMIMRGVPQIWDFWKATQASAPQNVNRRELLKALQEEFYGASEYIKHCLANDIEA